MAKKRTAVSIIEAQEGFVAPPKRTGARKADRRYVVVNYGDGDGEHPYTLTPAGIAKVRELAAEGVLVTTIAEALGMGARSFAHVRKRQPEVQEALDAGRSALGTELTDILMTHARQGNIIAAIHLSKSRAGFQEGTGEVEGASPKTVNNTQINITIPPQYSPAEVAQIIGTLPSPEDEDQGGGATR